MQIFEDPMLTSRRRSDPSGGGDCSVYQYQSIKKLLSEDVIGYLHSVRGALANTEGEPDPLRVS